MKNLFTFFSLAFLTTLTSCNKDFSCVCESRKQIDAIYYNNKIETEAIASSTYDYETIKAREKEAKDRCSAKNSSFEEVNTALLEGRSGGLISHKKTCSIQ